MKNQGVNIQETITVEEVIERYGILRLWHKAACVIAVMLVCCMAGFIIWGIMFDALRVLLIVFGIILGICGAVMYVMIHRIYVKMGAAIPQFLRASGMSEPEVLQKIRELKIKLPDNAKKTNSK